MLYALEAFASLCRTLYRRQPSTKSYSKEFLGPSFKLRQLVLKKDAVPTIFNFTMERCKPAIGQETTKNERIMPAKERANSSAISQVK